MYTDECKQSAEAETISNSHRRVKTKSTGQAKCRKEGSEPCVGGVTEPGGWLKWGSNPGLHVCCMTDCVSICICSISLPSPSACTPTSLSQSFAWKQGKGSGRERITYGWLDQHLATHHITSKHRARHSTAWHGKADTITNRCC